MEISMSSDREKRFERRQREEKKKQENYYKKLKKGKKHERESQDLTNCFQKRNQLDKFDEEEQGCFYKENLNKSEEDLKGEM
jgi:hypothetical protein